ncbi:MAG: hypothetical protein COT46_01285 [Sulfurimonas sp. CG08_land_8_20_14_0_20_36_33]|nr:MAG: hypothetical protein COT46_01285 [Sulfurimonas sp. CG08_land_8_20_14_0_20_36_33]PIW52884.1 MAG: hypothetical protein COW17_05460 [Sulfurimonas sp. CG12_big_fil_rev_8_21_14_0_65_36_1453]PJE70465.1 MAG: hypothetical protein COU99_11575 [Sulfurimonas sp. CG10_big_fil_rev_8_21_14_0_10_36_24]
MNKENQHSFSSVVSANPYKNTYLSGMSSFLTETTSPEYIKNQFVISYLNTNDFITSQLEITKNIPEEDLFDAINNKIYDDLGLDQVVSYQVQYIETFNNLDEDNRHFQVFIVDPFIISETFKNVVNSIKYIDIIVPLPLLLKSLYSKEIVQNSGVHCYVYFQENDTFVTFYNEKEFVYTKSIKYSFLQMHERFCELYGERIEYEDFLDFLTNENLKDTKSEYKEHIIKLYKEIFANINDILTFVKRAFEIERIEHLYIGSQVYTVTKLDEMAEVELSIKSSDFAFDYGFEGEGTYIDQIHALMHVYTTLPSNERYECNFTTFPRPAKFQHRESGKLILLAVASLLIAFIYPVTYWALTYAQTLQYELLQGEYTELHTVKTTREATIKNREADKEKTLALLAKEQQNYNEKKATLIKIHEVKIDYPMKSKLLALLTKDLNKYNVNVSDLSYFEDNSTKNFKLNLVSSNDKKITQMIEYLTKIYGGKFHFSLEEISYKEANKKYFAELKVRIL